MKRERKSGKISTFYQRFAEIVKLERVLPFPSVPKDS